MDSIPRSAELAARLTVACDAAAAYGRNRHIFLAGGPSLDWYHWAERLSIALDGLIDLIGSGSPYRVPPGPARPAAAPTGVRADGTVVLSAADAATVRDVLGYALDIRAERAAAVGPDCACGPSGYCDDRAEDAHALADYRNVLERIEASR